MFGLGLSLRLHGISVIKAVIKVRLLNWHEVQPRQWQYFLLHKIHEYMNISCLFRPACIQKKEEEAIARTSQG